MQYNTHCVLYMYLHAVTDMPGHNYVSEREREREREGGRRERGREREIKGRRERDEFLPPTYL